MIDNFKISQLIELTRKKFNLPAIAVCIVNSSGVLMADVQGVKYAGSNEEVSLNDYFHIGSCSKSFLGIIAVKVIEQKLIKWETGFFDLFPELKKNTKSIYHKITLKDLFLCKAGIKPFTNLEKETLPQLPEGDDNNFYKFAKYLLNLEPAAKFGKNGFGFAYSNASYSMADLMIEKATGLSYKQLVEKYINGDMKIETIFGFPNKYNEKQPWGHMLNGKDLETFDPECKYVLPALISPAGDLSLTPLMFADYLIENLKGFKGESNFLKKDSFEFLHFGNKIFSIGLANGKILGKNFSGMDGSAGTFFCRAFFFRDSDLAVLIMTNAGTSTGRMKSVDWLTMKIIKEIFNLRWKFWI
ncbi:MAG: beta-lactamase family protein [Ignavibacteria bacterium]|nr:beta-lactamase family protein [Ignavibacteria bacterium]